MKAINNHVTLVKRIIFFAGLSLGLVAGILMNNLRSGIALGIATGLTGIIGFLYYQEGITKQNEKLKNSAIPIRNHKMKNAA
jgi:hypothetical protein